MSDDAARAPVIGVLFLGAALMTTEVVMTRIFSVVIWYHFAFFAISVALFGAGAAGVVVHALGSSLTPARAASHVAWSSAAFVASVVVTDLVLTRLVPGWFAALFSHPSGAALVHVLLLFLTSAAPFFTGGYAVSLVMTRAPRRIDALYSADLVGSAAGAALSVPFLSLLGGPGALVAAAALGAVSTLAFSRAAGERRAAGSSWLAVAFGAALLATAQLDSVSAKGFDLRQKRPEFDRWNAFSRVTVFGDAPFRGWGTSPSYRGPLPEQKAVFIDMAAFTPLARFDGDPRSAAHTLFDLSAFPYRVHPRLEQVCVIGAGGGKDVLAALAAGARGVTAAEINPLVVNGVVGGAFREFSGDLYRRPEVRVHVEDGRSLVRSIDGRFDVVLISMVDTSAASTAGAFALTENSLYTVEAFGDFLDRLAPGGILSVSTVSLPRLVLGARLVSVARAALERRGASPAKSIAVIQTPWLGGAAGVMHNLLVAPDGFSEEVARRIAASAKELGFTPSYFPGQLDAVSSGEGKWIRRIATEPDPQVLMQELAALPFDASPSTDDRPFFFYQDRIASFVPSLLRAGEGHSLGEGLTVLSKVLVVTVLLVAACLLVPAWITRRRARERGRPAAWDVAYVTCLGLGFLFVEIAFIQRISLYLGQPTYTLAVVLSVLLLTSGAGARLLPRRIARRRRGLTAFLALATAVLALAGVCVRPALEAVLGAPPLVRALVSAAVVAPVGFVLGAPFPAGVGAVAGEAPDRVAWLWAVNSATSVLGSVLATFISLHAGIGMTFLAGLLAYLTATVLSVPITRSA